MSFDPHQTLQELLNITWPEPAADASGLIATKRRLIRKPIAEFTIEDLRLMIGQEIGLIYLIPVAIERLRANPLVSGDMFPGDLLVNILTVRPIFWMEHPELRDEVYGILLEVARMAGARSRPS